MKNIIPFSFFILITFTIKSQITTDEDNMFKYPLKAVSVYCFINPDSSSLVDKTILIYDKENRLIKTSSSTSETIYSYNLSGLLVSKKWRLLHIKTNQDTLFEYYYDSQNRLVRTVKDNNPKKSVLFKYDEHNLLISQKDSFSNVIYMYEYDNFFRLVKKFRNDTLTNSYKYRGLNIIEETVYEKDRTVFISYDYDANAFLIDKKINSNISERYMYVNGRLDRKKIYGVKSPNNECLNQWVQYEYLP